MSTWPNFFIVGAPRCGTTSLYEYLNQTSGVYMSPIKEPNFFSVSINPELKLATLIRDKKKYLKLFKNVKNEKAIGEASPTYLWDPKAPGLIHDIIPEARIIIILRDPVERAYSHYLYLRGFGYENTSFSDSIKSALKAKSDFSGRILETGSYFQQVKRYYKIFESNQIKVIIFEEFISDTWNKVKEILGFLGVTRDPPNSINEIHNPFKLPRGKITTAIITNPFLRKMVRQVNFEWTKEPLKKIFTKKSPKPILSSKDRKFLEEYYREDVKNLQQFLQKTLPWKIAQDKGGKL